MKAKLSVTVNRWSGWENKSTKPVRLQFICEESFILAPEALKLNLKEEVLSLKIFSITSEEIVIKYSGLVLESANHGINLRAPRKGEIVIKLQDSITFVTPTMDS